MKKPIDVICDFYMAHSLLPAHEIEYMRYAMLSVFSETIKLLLFLVLFLLLDKLFAFGLILLVLFPIRWASGGVHARTFWGCFSASLLWLLFLVYVPPYLPMNLLLQALLLFLALLSIRHIPYTPAFRPITRQRTIRILRYCYLVLVCLWILVFNIADMPAAYTRIVFYAILLQVLQLFIPHTQKGGVVHV